MGELNLTTSFVSTVATDLLALATGIVVKREDLAQKHETLETARAWDIYIAALTQSDTFSSYASFTDSVLSAAGLTAEQIASAKISKYNIPEDKRDLVVTLQRAYHVANFVENNNYYRMLNGLPSTDDTEYIYIATPVQGVDISKPIHLMTNEEIIILNTFGTLGTVIANNPQKGYLKFLGINKIDVLTARTSKKFDILRLGYITNTALRKRFRMNYELSRTYILNNYYKRRYSIDQTYFDAYIGFIILTNALIMVINNSVDIFNTKEAINDTTVHEILQSFNVDLFDDISALYRKKISDNIQSLLVSKGADEVIFKIFKIYGFDNITIRKFMLVKDHKKDIDDNYIFSYEADGVTPKWDDMYEVYFSQVDITSNNIDTEIREPENKLAYFDVVDKDIYWGAYETNESIRQRLLQGDFNYIDTDYININTAYAISRLTTEITYFMSMVLNLKANLDKLIFVEPFFGQSINIFYSIVMLAAMISKKIGFDGNLITDGVGTAIIYQYNFNRSLTELTAIMNKYKYTNSNNLATILPSGALDDPAQLVDLYFSNDTVLDRLISLKTSVKTLNEYLAVKEILDYMTTGTVAASTFTKPDGQVATTYLDYLNSINSPIAMYIDGLQLADLDTAITKLLTALEDYVNTSEFEFLFVNIPTFSGENVLKTYIQKIINVFKAFNINIFSMSITYDIDDLKNNVKIIDKVVYEGHPRFHTNVPIIDTLGIRSTKYLSDGFNVQDDVSWTDKNGDRFHL